MKTKLGFFLIISIFCLEAGFTQDTRTLAERASGVSGYFTANDIPQFGPSNVPRSGLVGEWLFNGDFKDSSGKNNHQNNFGAVFSSDRNGKNTALYLNGSSYLSLSSADMYNFGTSAFSVSVWIKTSVLNDVGIVAKYYADNNYGWKLKKRYDGGIGLLTNENGNWDQKFTSLKENDDKWHHLVAVRNASGQKIIYMDGVEQLNYLERESGGARNVNSTMALEFGRSHTSADASWSYVTGSIDDVRIYNRQLSASEVIQLQKETPQASIAGTSRKLGNFTEFDGTSSHSPDYLLGSKVEVTEDGLTLNKFGVIAKATGGKYKMALYTDVGGKPGRLIASTGAESLFKGANETQVSSVRLSRGSYWLMAIFDVTSSIGQKTSSDNTIQYVSLTFNSSLPLDFSSSPSTYTGNYFNYYLVCSK